MECPHITQGQTVSLTLKDLTSIIKGGVKCEGMYIHYYISFLTEFSQAFTSIEARIASYIYDVCN